MNLTKKITSWFLALVMLLGLLSQTIFAQETVAPSLQYEVTQQMSEDQTQVTISLQFVESETIHVNTVTLPDGTVLTETGTQVDYRVAENGIYNFKVNYTTENAPQEEMISVEVADLIESENLTQNGVKQIHLNSLDGDDNNDGTAAQTSVKSFAKAKSLMQDGDIILLDSYYEVTQAESWDLSEFPNSKVQRNCNANMIYIGDQSSLTLSNIRIDGHHFQDYDESTFESIIRMGSHQGTEANSSSLVLNSGTILENNINSGGYGGAINANSYNTITMNDGAIIQNNGTIENDRGPIYGGAINLENHSNFIMNGGTIDNNHAVTGGAISIIASSMTMNGGLIENNSANNEESFAGHYGGAICLRNFASISGAPSYDIKGEASFTMNGGTISGNKATYSKNGDNGLGGAIATLPDWVNGCESEPKITINISGGNIVGNEAMNGGAISAYFKAVDVKVSNAIISGNTARSQGGAIYNVFNANVDLTNTTISQNSADFGGGAYLYASDLTMHSGEISHNVASSNGGGIYIDNPAWRDQYATCTILGGIVQGNKATAGQGSDGIYQDRKLQIGENALIDQDNDVYLPSGRVIDVISPLTGISHQNYVTITSQDCVVEDEQNKGTKLVHYLADAGGVDAAQNAEIEQHYIPSKYMQEGLVIGKSNAQDQLDYMTYVQKQTYPVVYEFVSGTNGKTLPQEVLDLRPVDPNRYIEGATIHAIQPSVTEVQVSGGTWTFKGYDATTKVANADNAKNGVIQFTGTWTFKKSTGPDKPTDPDKPVDPDQPDPDKPTDPNEPVDPNKPTNPGKPDDPNKPSDPTHPGNPNANNPGSQNPNLPNKPGSVGTGLRTSLLFSSVLLLISGICMLGAVGLKAYKFNENN